MVVQCLAPLHNIGSDTCSSLLFSALEYHNLDTSVATKIYWVTTGKLFLISAFLSLRLLPFPVKNLTLLRPFPCFWATSGPQWEGDLHPTFCVFPKTFKEVLQVFLLETDAKKVLTRICQGKCSVIEFYTLLVQSGWLKSGTLGWTQVSPHESQCRFTHSCCISRVPSG